MTPQLIVINGAPGSGKDESATYLLNWLAQQGHKVRFDKVSNPLKWTLSAIINGPGRMGALPDATPHFHVDSRQWQIDFSERFLKRYFGPTILADLLVTRLLQQMRDNGIKHFITECGFQKELDTLLKTFGNENVFLIRLLRPGTSYKGDSRHQITAPSQVTIHNDSTLSVLHFQLRSAMGLWISGQ